MYNSGLPLGPVVKNPPASAGGMGSIPGPGRSHVLWATKPVYHNQFLLQLLKKRIIYLILIALAQQQRRSAVKIKQINIFS